MLRIKNVYKSFNSHNVLNNVNIKIKKGELVTIMGKSGSGKSVLLKMLIGIVGVSHGEIWIDKYPLHNLKGNELLNAIKDIKIGFMFQNGALFDSISIYENVRFYLDYYNIGSEDERHKKTISILNQVGLSESKDKRPKDLSGGMIKRASLAKVLVYDPNLLIIDEPTSGLDPTTSREIVDLIYNMWKNRSKNLTCITVTHDDYCASVLGNKIFECKDKSIKEVSSIKTFFN